MPLEHDVPLDQKINIRIHTDHKCPKRVVFDMTNSVLVKSADAETIASRSEPAVARKTPAFDAFAEMADVPVRGCFRPPCSARLRRDRPLRSWKGRNFKLTRA